ncbi:MAG: hypothetical protein K2K73_03050 [Ureaplasma sp.]|nr:hypothetical protein [Ureaplasma sp.]
MNKVKTLLICSLIPIIGYWGFNFAGYAGLASTAGNNWAIWIFINLLFAGAAVGLIVGLYFVTKRLKSQNSTLYRLFKHLNSLCIACFVIIPLAFIVDLLIFIKTANMDIILTSINVVIIGTLLGIMIYATVRAFRFRSHA